MSEVSLWWQVTLENFEERRGARIDSPHSLLAMRRFGVVQVLSLSALCLSVRPFHQKSTCLTQL